MRIVSLAAAARHAGVTPTTIRAWRERDWLPAPPWTPWQLDRAADRSRQRAGRGSTVEHGESRWRAGCRCDTCRTDHTAVSNSRREAARVEWWQSREQPLLDLLAGGAVYREALVEVGVTAQAVTAHRHRSPGFAERLDDALTAGRDETLEHGTARTWRQGCRCPECRAVHEASR